MLSSSRVYLQAEWRRFSSPCWCRCCDVRGKGVGLPRRAPTSVDEGHRGVRLARWAFRGLVVRAATVVAPKYTTLKPLADRVLVKIKSSEEKTSSGILLPTTAQSKPQSGEVVAIGEGRTIGDNKVDVNIQVGAQVLYSKYAGTEVELNDSNHLVLKEDDIIGILETDDVKDMKPLNDRVLIKVAEAEEKTPGGLLLTETAKEKPSIGTVVAVGPGPRRGRQEEPVVRLCRQYRYVLQILWQRVQGF